MSTVTINGVEYTPTKQSDDVRIVILQRGWVFIGNYQKLSDTECILTNAKNYRRQKSGKGFGYVAKNGPSENCELDLCELPVRFHPMTVIASIDCAGDKWNLT
jgi:hypothetical protein